VAKWALTTRRLWQRLGVRDPDSEEPEVVYAVQPTYLVGDGSALVPPTLPPLAWAGALVTQVLTEHWALAIQAIAPGGCFVPSLEVAATFTGRFSFLDAIPAAVTNVIPNRDMGPLPVASRVLSEYIPAASVVLGAEHPTVSSGVVGQWSVFDGIYIPAGRVFYLESAVVGPVTSTSFACQIQDVPEAIPANPT